MNICRALYFVHSILKFCFLVVFKHFHNTPSLIILYMLLVITTCNSEWHCWNVWLNFLLMKGLTKNKGCTPLRLQYTLYTSQFTSVHAKS